MTTARNPWLLSGGPGEAEDGATRALVCIPHLGGNAAMFGWWAGRLGAGVTVLPIQLPGRGSRATEPALRTMPEIVEALAHGLGPVLGPPVALYGHSFGALVAFELARLMEHGLGRGPERLIVGAARPPDAPLDRPYLHDAPDAQVLAYLRSLEGTPEALIADEELRALILPAVRADLEAWETYRFAAAPPLAAPITALAGAMDRTVSPADMRGWAHHTRAGFRQVTVPGGHFFLRDARDEVVRVLAAEVGGRTAA